MVITTYKTPEARTRWHKAWRIIASRYPPINLFERLTPDPGVWDALIKLEELTNPRVRDATGQIHLVPPERRISGPGASQVMACFAHVNPKGSRFSDGNYGMYYCANSLETAIAETVYHFEQFAADSGDPERYEDMRVLLGSIDHTFLRLDQVDDSVREPLLNPDSYAQSQPWGTEQREAEYNGIVFPSVRDEGGMCLGAFWPNTVNIPVQERHLQYHWNGKTVDRYFDYRRDQWLNL